MGPHLTTSCFVKKMAMRRLFEKIRSLNGYCGSRRRGFSPDGKIATRAYDGTVKLWDWVSGKEIAALYVNVDAEHYAPKERLSDGAFARTWISADWRSALGVAA
jgi:WD40 repeat protein